MITACFSIQNPFRVSKWASLYQREWEITKNKNLEVGVSFYTYDLLGLTLDLRWFGSDHVGPRIEVNVFGVEFCLAISDNRHWDVFNRCWEDNRG